MLQPDALQHVVNAIGDDLLKAAVDAGLRKVMGTISRAVGRRLKNAEDLDDADALRIEVDRLRSLTEILKQELDEVVRHFGTDSSRLDESGSDPGFRSFVDKALSAATDTPLESKRGVLAAMIAQRLQLRSDSHEEVRLRRASEILPYLSEQQLRLLAAVFIVQYLPQDDLALKFETRDEAEVWLHERYFAIARRLKNTSHWVRDDFEMLAALGAIRIDESVPKKFHYVGGKRNVGTTALYQWLGNHGVRPDEGIDGEIGTKSSHEAYARRYPTISLLSKLTMGEGPGGAYAGFQLDTDVRFTPIGEYLARLIFERLTGRRSRKLIVLGDRSDKSGEKLEGGVEAE